MADDEQRGEETDAEAEQTTDTADHQAANSGEDSEPTTAQPADTDGTNAATSDDTNYGRVRQQMLLNRQTWGRLILHFPARDVAVPLDGSTAMRVLRMFADRNHDWHGDRFDWTASAMNGWFVYDSTEPIAMSWEPDLPGRERRRTVIDPPAAA